MGVFFSLVVLLATWVALFPSSGQAINPDLPQVAYVELPSKEFLKQNQLTLGQWIQQVQQQHPGRHLRFQDCRETGQESSWGKQCSTPYGEKAIVSQDFAGWLAGPEKKIGWRQDEIAARDKYLASYFGQAWEQSAQAASEQARAARAAIDETAKRAQLAQERIDQAARRREVATAQQAAAATELEQVNTKLQEVQIQLRDYVASKSGEAQSGPVTDFGRQLGTHEQTILRLREQYTAAAGKLDRANGELGNAQQDLAQAQRLKAESEQAFAQVAASAEKAKALTREQRERLAADAQALTADEIRQLAISTAANTFQKAEEENRMHEILTLKQDVLKSRFKLTEQALDFLAANVQNHLQHTLLGKFINTQIAKLATGLCDLQKKCAVSDLISAQDVEKLLGAPAGTCNP